MVLTESINDDSYKPPKSTKASQDDLQNQKHLPQFITNILKAAEAADVNNNLVMNEEDMVIEDDYDFDHEKTSTSLPRTILQESEI